MTNWDTTRNTLKCEYHPFQQTNKQTQNNHEKLEIITKHLEYFTNCDDSVLLCCVLIVNLTHFRITKKISSSVGFANFEQYFDESQFKKCVLFSEDLN